MNRQKQKLQDFSSEFESLCNHGCSGGRVMQTREALANPAAFTRCHGLSLKTPVKITVGMYAAYKCCSLLHIFVEVNGKKEFDSFLLSAETFTC